MSKTELIEGTDGTADYPYPARLNHVKCVLFGMFGLVNGIGTLFLVSFCCGICCHSKNWRFFCFWCVLRVGVVAAVYIIDAVSRNPLFVWMIETVHLVVLVYLCQSFETLVQKERIT